jgi:hypothetical protein
MITNMLKDAEASRQTAHIFLDALAVNNPQDPTDDDTRNDMTALVSNGSPT